MIKFIIRISIILSLLQFTSCSKDENTIFTQLSIRLVMPDSRPVERIEILSDISYFYNINTYEFTPFPDVIHNSDPIQLRKGVYTLIVEADATYSNGEVKRLRIADYNQTTQALTWVQDHESVVLLFKSVN